MISPQVANIRDRSDIVSIVSESVPLKKAGQNHVGCCPFHAEKTPSFVVSPAKQVFHCFGCGAGGDVFSFLMQHQRLSFPEAVERLAIRAGLALPTPKTRGQDAKTRAQNESLYAINAAAADYFHQTLLGPEGVHARAYLKTRGITDDTVRAFLIGYAPPKWDGLLKKLGTRFAPSGLLAAGLISQKGDATPDARFYDRFRNRILFPIRSREGDGVGFGARALDDALPKYLNTPETPVFSKGRHLFGSDRIAEARQDALIVVEGYFDAVAAHQAGFTRTVATMGTALTEAHVGLIRRLTECVVLALDPDDAGDRATFKASLLLLEHGVPTRIVALPRGEDPDTFIRKDQKAFAENLTAARSPTDYFIATWGNPMAPFQDKVKIAGDLFALIRRLKTKMEQGHALRHLADALEFSESDVRAEFARSASPKGAGVSLGRPGAAIRGMGRVQKDEERILSQLIQGRMDLSLLNGRLQPSDFTHSEIQSVIADYWDGTRWWCGDPLPLVSGQPDAPQVGHGSRRGVDTPEMNEEVDEARITQDAVAAILARRLDAESGRLQAQVKQAEAQGDWERIHSLQDRLASVRQERRHLRAQVVESEPVWPV